MKVCVQRVKKAKLEIEGKEICSFESGLVVFVGFTNGDTIEKIDYIVNKVAGLRVFEDENEKMNLSAENVGGSFLVIPNFTLYANCERGFRPGFENALNPAEASPLFDLFVKKMKEKYPKVFSGVFGANMQITQQNDGPISIIIERD